MKGQVVLYTEEELEAQRVEMMRQAFFRGYADARLDLVGVSRFDERGAEDAFQAWLREREAQGL